MLFLSKEFDLKSKVTWVKGSEVSLKTDQVMKSSIQLIAIVPKV
jgi:hypothetical protein